MSFFNKLLGKTPTAEEVVDYLDAIPLTRQKCRDEKQAETHIQKMLKSALDEDFTEIKVHTQYSVGGNRGLKIDIDIAEDVGIEIKMAKQLIANATNLQRLVGQVVYYKRKMYGKDLIVLVVGSEENESNPDIIDLSEIIVDLNVWYHYKVVK